MVINNLHLVRAAIPNETDAPLIVDPNAVLALPLASQSLQAIAGRFLQRVQAWRSVQLTKLASGGPLNVGRESGRDLIIEDALRFSAPEGSDHTVYYRDSLLTSSGMNIECVKRQVSIVTRATTPVGQLASNLLTYDRRWPQCPSSTSVSGAI